MPVFLELTDSDIADPNFFDNIDIGTDSTIDVTRINDNFQIVLTGNSLTFANAATGQTFQFTDADLQSGSFSNIVQYDGNDGDSVVSGSVGLNANGYIGGSGDDNFTDDGTLPGQLSGGVGDDTIQGGIADNQIAGGPGDDVLSGGDGNNNLDGGAGNDTLFGDTGSGNLLGGGGSDVIVASTETTFVNGGGGNDTLIVPEDAIVTPFSATGGNVTTASGNTFTYLNIQNVTTEPLPCFVAGTRIKTDRGEVLVETISAGDIVETKDHGLQPVRFIGQRTVSGKGRFAPIAFATGTIGNTRALLLSPQHRVLLSHWRAELLFGTPEVLTPAKHLMNGDTIKTAPREEVTYVHLLFDHHEIVCSEGAWTESFHPGEASLDGFGAETREEIVALFPELADPAYCKSRPAARLCLKAFEARALFDDQNEPKQSVAQDFATFHQGALTDLSPTGSKGSQIH